MYGSRAHRKYSLASMEFNQQSLSDPGEIPEASRVHVSKSKAWRGSSSCQSSVEKESQQHNGGKLLLPETSPKGMKSGSADKGGNTLGARLPRTIAHPFRSSSSPNVLIDQHRSLKCASCMHRLFETSLLIRSPALVMRF